MIIYNKTWLSNLKLHNEVQVLHNAGCLTAKEASDIKEKNPVGFYTPGIFIRIGLFILTCITVICSFGLLSILIEASGLLQSFTWPLFLGIVCAIALELNTAAKNYYRAGIDDALMWMATLMITGALWWMLKPNRYDQHADTIAVSSVILTVSLAATIRYADTLMSAICSLAGFALIFFFWTRFGFIGTSTVPFIIMIAACLAYFLLLNRPNKTALKYYDNCFIAAQIISLLVLYAAGNYFITDWANHQLNNIPQNVKLKVTWAPFFWACTMLIPLAYIALGILKKNVIALRVGLLLIVAGAATFRYYYHIMSLELALILCGAVLLIIVYLVVRYLKTPKYGFTYTDIDDADHINIEGLITAATFKHQQTPNGPANKFGGGNFGGGGSGGQF